MHMLIYPAWLGLNFGLHPFFVYMIREGSYESGHMQRLIRAFVDKYQIPMYWPICSHEDE